VSTEQSSCCEASDVLHFAFGECFLKFSMDEYEKGANAGRPAKGSQSEQPAGGTDAPSAADHIGDKVGNQSTI